MRRPGTSSSQRSCSSPKRRGPRACLSGPSSRSTPTRRTVSHSPRSRPMRRGTSSSFGTASDRRALPTVFSDNVTPAPAPPSAEFRVNSYTTNRQWRPKVASDPSGNFVVVWSSGGQDGSGYGVFGQRYDAPAGSSAPSSRSTPTPREIRAMPPWLPIPPATSSIAWDSTESSTARVRGVFAQRYASAGTPRIRVPRRTLTRRACS